MQMMTKKLNSVSNGASDIGGKNDVSKIIIPTSIITTSNLVQTGSH